MSGSHSPTNQERFDTYVHPEPNTGCWLWSGALSRSGYGHFGTFGRTVLAHRWMYEWKVGRIPDGLCMDHLCRVRCCVNPDHLEPVTKGENSRRSPIMGRPDKGWRLTHCKRGHPYSGPNVWFSVNGLRRQCKACWAARKKPNLPGTVAA